MRYGSRFACLRGRNQVALPDNEQLLESGLRRNQAGLADNLNALEYRDDGIHLPEAHDSHTFFIPISLLLISSFMTAPGRTT
ncbi:hypothetical protein D3C75_1228640 [compost metagenome]